MKLEIINSLPAVLDNDSNVILQDITLGMCYPVEGKNTFVAPSGQWQISHDNKKWYATCNSSKITFWEDENGICMQSTLVNTGDDVSAVNSIVALAGNLPCRPDKVFGNLPSNNGGNPTNEMLSMAETYKYTTGQSQTFADFVATVTEDEKNVIAGYLTYKECYGLVELDYNGKVTFSEVTEGHPMAKNEAFVSDIFYIGHYDDVITGLPQYCDLAVKYMCPNGNPMRFDVPCGYCTWYYYLGDISDEIIENSVCDIAGNKDKLPLKYMQIDDGWQIGYGNWEPHKEKFAKGDMKAHADKIKANGFLPGLWFAPIWLGMYSEFKKEHPECMAKDKNGQITACLDLSVELSRKWLGEVFRKVTYDWGYKYIKLDGITAVLGAYNFADPTFNAVKNYRTALQVINDNIPDDVFVLGCTAPFGSAIGLVDGMRVSCDIFESWQAVKDVFNSVLNRYYYHKRFFINDADCLIIRKSENEDDECRRNCTRSDTEIKTYISATAASGGILMLSDKLRLLGDDQIDLLSYLFPTNKEAAIPLDLMDARTPGILDVGTKGIIRTVMLINWDDEAKEMGIDVNDSHVFEFWSKEYKGVVNGRYTATIEPHDCQVLFITANDTPAVIGTDSTIVADIKQSYADGKLTFEFNKKNETLFIAANNVVGDNVTKITDGLYSIKQVGDAMAVELWAE